MNHVLPSDVDDEGDAWLERDEVREVLVGRDPEIHPARTRGALQLRDDVHERRLVRDEVVRAKESAGLRELRDDPPERRIAEAIGDLSCGGRGAGGSVGVGANRTVGGDGRRTRARRQYKRSETQATSANLKHRETLVERRSRSSC